MVRMTTETTTKTDPLTEAQASILNSLARATDGLNRGLSDLAARVHEQQQRVDLRQHLEGFDSDVLGQAARKVQHHGSERAAFLAAAVASGIHDAVVLEALGYDVEARVRRPKFFSAGYSLDLASEEV